MMLGLRGECWFELPSEYNWEARFGSPRRVSWMEGSMSPAPTIGIVCVLFNYSATSWSEPDELRTSMRLRAMVLRGEAGYFLAMGSSALRRGVGSLSLFLEKRRGVGRLSLKETLLRAENFGVLSSMSERRFTSSL